MSTQNQCYNLCTLVGWVQNINKVGDRWEFDLRQTPNPDHVLKIKLNSGIYLPRFLQESEHPLVKLVGSMFPDFDSTSKLTTIKITKKNDPKISKWLSRPNIIEMPSSKGQNFINKDGECTPYLEWDGYLTLSNEDQQKITNKLANSSGIAGWVSGKRMHSDECLIIDIEYDEKKVIPVRFYNNRAIDFYKKLMFMQPLFITGKLQSNKNKETGIIETYIKTNTITGVCQPGRHIPKKAPQWVVDRNQEFSDKSIKNIKIPDLVESYIKEPVKTHTINSN